MGMAATKFWTVEELDQLPDDGNKYEIIDGELFVTPSPAPDHQHAIARLLVPLVPFAVAHGLGMVFVPPTPVRDSVSSVEPDLMVRQPADDMDRPWQEAPTPILVVEVHSPGTRRRDRSQKRAFYMRSGITEYWMVDPKERTITQVRPGQDDVVARDTLTWRPPGIAAELAIDVPAVFGRG